MILRNHTTALVLTALLGSFATARLASADPDDDDDDDYTEQDIVQGKVVEVCGRFPFIVEAEWVRAKKFGPYQYNVRGDLEKLPCDKLVKKNKFGKEVADAVAAMRKDQEDPSIIVVQTDKPYEGSKDTGERDRFLPLMAYSKHMKGLDGPCGAGYQCEAGGFEVPGTWNKLEHALARAAVHAGKDEARCKAQLKIAASKITWFAQEHELHGKLPYWKKMKYVNRAGDTKLDAAGLEKHFAAREALIKERTAGTYCAKGK